MGGCDKKTHDGIVRGAMTGACRSSSCRGADASRKRMGATLGSGTDMSRMVRARAGNIDEGRGGRPAQGIARCRERHDHGTAATMMSAGRGPGRLVPGPRRFPRRIRVPRRCSARASESRHGVAQDITPAKISTNDAFDNAVNLRARDGRLGQCPV